MPRELIEIFDGHKTVDGAGVHLKRVFGFHDVPKLDPFLLLDEFRSDNPEEYLKGFPWHPHRGIETITYLLEGRVEHGDSLGNSGLIRPGEVQWMTAGSGIIHQEMPKGDDNGRLWGFQLWANLRSDYKMADPRYRGLQAAQIPLLELEDGVQLRIIAGRVAGIKGPVRDLVIEPQYLDVTLPPQACFSHSLPFKHAAMLYLIEGQSPLGLNSGQLGLLGPGEEISIAAGPEGCRFLFLAGKTLRERIAWRGPIVMNSYDELDQAFDEYQKGTFIKHKE